MLIAASAVTLLLWLLLFGLVARRRRHGGGASGAGEVVAELFQPARRHVREERDRRLALRDDTDAGAPPGTGVDLEAGVARIRRAEPSRPFRSGAPRDRAPGAPSARD